MTIGSRHFFVRDTSVADLFEPVEPARLDRERLTGVIEGPDPTAPDVDVALALMDLVRDDLSKSGTDGSEVLDDDEMRLAVRAMQRTSARAGHEFTLPFRDHTGWRRWWNQNGAYGSWQARRDLLGRLFDEPYAALMAAQDRALDAVLAEAVSPQERLGWPELDTEIGELRRRFRSAITAQDYRAVGNDCVHLTEALSRKVYDHAAHPLHRGEVAGPGEPRTPEVRPCLDRTRAGREALRHSDAHRGGHPRGRRDHAREHASSARRGAWNVTI